MVRPSHDVSRLEGFSDAVFGFALTLLVVQLEAPRSADELRMLVRASAPFALTFAMVCYLWWEHNRFFRLFGLQDAWTAFLNCVLLFVVLFYVYPLKFLTTALIGPLVGLPRGTAFDDGRFVLLVYSAGVFVIFGTFVLLYRHAARRQTELDLDAAARVTLRYKTRAHVMSTLLAALSLALSASLPSRWIWLGGVIYGLMGPLHAWNGYRARIAHEALGGADSSPPRQRSSS
jgi:uncharacterized membrane protein